MTARKRVKDIEARLEALEAAVGNAFQLIAQLDIIHYAVGETLIAKGVYTKDDVSKRIQEELDKRNKQPEIVEAPQPVVEDITMGIPKTRPAEPKPIPQV